MILWTMALNTAAIGQTVAQSEASMAYLKRIACIEPAPGGGFRYAGGSRTPCTADSSCAAPATCEHESLVRSAASLYPKLEFPDDPVAGGRGEAIVRYVPLCEDGSGDHEYSVSNGALGTPPTCAPNTFIRCGDGVRPQYKLDASTSAPRSRDYLIHAGSGGHMSSPGHYEPVWAYYNTLDVVAYTATSPPNVESDLSGLYDAGNANPFASYNRVLIEKCTADAWLGNSDMEGVLDFTTEQPVAFQVGACRDANGDGIANCDDRLADPGACACMVRTVAPPVSADHSYSVFYHGRRIVHAVMADLAVGATGYVTYPLVDDGTGQARVRPGDEVMLPPRATSKMAFTCHSAGCASLEGGMIDELHTMVDRAVGADVDVRAIFNSFGNPAVEVEACVSEFDGVDVAPRDGVADHPGVIDDTCSVYDQVVDTVSASGEGMSYQVFEPGGFLTVGLADYHTPAPGYGPPVDASCLADHCPGTADWSADPACTPCNNPLHVLFNHLNTPFVYNEALRDSNQIDTASGYCDSPPGDLFPCDYNGDLTGVDLGSTHWRQLVRKQFADAFRWGETDRCEGGVGLEWPYDHMLLLLPDRTSHSSLLDDGTVALPLDLAGPVQSASMGEATWWFMSSTSPTSPVKAMCMQEEFVGENAGDFTAGGVPGCE